MCLPTVSFRVAGSKFPICLPSPCISLTGRHLAYILVGDQTFQVSRWVWPGGCGHGPAGAVPLPPADRRPASTAPRHSLTNSMTFSTFSYDDHDPLLEGAVIQSIRLLDEYVIVQQNDMTLLSIWNIATRTYHTLQPPGHVLSLETNGNLVLFVCYEANWVYDASNRSLVKLDALSNCSCTIVDAGTQTASLLSMGHLKTYSTVTGNFVSEIIEVCQQQTSRSQHWVHCTEHLYIIFGHHQCPPPNSSLGDLYSECCLFDSRVRRVKYQCLQLKGLRNFPQRIYMSDKTIHALLKDNSIAIATEVPMVTGDDGSFFQVDFTIIPRKEYHKEWNIKGRASYAFPVFTVSHDLAIFLRSDNRHHDYFLFHYCMQFPMNESGVVYPEEEKEYSNESGDEDEDDEGSDDGEDDEDDENSEDGEDDEGINDGEDNEDNEDSEDGEDDCNGRADWALGSGTRTRSTLSGGRGQDRTGQERGAAAAKDRIG